MRIALVASPYNRVTAQISAGLEKVVADLAHVLCERGHDVTIFGAVGSTPVHQKCGVITYAPETNSLDPAAMWNAEHAIVEFADILSRFDIIHSHTNLGAVYKIKRWYPDAKILHTIHNKLPIPFTEISTAILGTVMGAFIPEESDLHVPVLYKPSYVQNMNLVSISRYMQSATEQAVTIAPTKVVYDGIDVSQQTLVKEKNQDASRTLFLGRLASWKRPMAAMDAAYRAGYPIDVVGRSGNEPFVIDQTKEIRRFLMAMPNSHLYVNASPMVKNQLLSRARCLIAPSQEEPFGLVALEAMASGTPVITMADSGGMKETVNHGITGFICRDVEEMAQAIKTCGSLDPAACRQWVEQYFTREIMADNYLRLYGQIADGHEW